MEEKLFFVSQEFNREAGVISPGNWGKGYENYAAKRFGRGGDPWKLIIELAIENERLRSYPHLPSRFTSSFLFPSVEAAKRTSDKDFWGPKNLVLWSAQLQQPHLPKHIGNCSLFDKIDGKSFPEVKEFAQQYWIGPHPTEHQELITASPIRLVEQLFVHSAQHGQWFPVPKQLPSGEVLQAPEPGISHIVE